MLLFSFSLEPLTYTFYRTLKSKHLSCFESIVRHIYFLLINEWKKHTNILILTGKGFVNTKAFTEGIGMEGVKEKKRKEKKGNY